MMISSNRSWTLNQTWALLLCLVQVAAGSAGVNRAELRDEHLLPVRMTRAATDADIEGSGDVDAVPIAALNSNVMERMTLQEESDKLGDKLEDVGSIETIENLDEGSGLEELSPSTESEWARAEVVGDNATAETTEREDAEETATEARTTTTTTTVVEETATDAPEAVTTEAVTEIVSEMAAKESVPSATEAAEETTTAKRDETTFPQVAVDAADTAATSAPEDKAPTTAAETEVMEAKHVKPLLAAEATAAPEDVPTTPRETASPTTPLPGGTVIAPENPSAPENENLTAGTDTLLMKANSRSLDSDEDLLLGSNDASRLGTYIVVSLILLSFLSLIGFILMKRRVRRRRKQGNLDPETLDTEKALLSLSEYKDHPDGLDEGKVKNNEITPIVIKSNSQINKFEKNTNFSSPKNLNTKANEKNVEKDNVLKRASDNLTQVIIEDPTKDGEEKAPTNAEKLIVRTHLDQDSIPKKPVIVNRTSVGSAVVQQD